MKVICKELKGSELVLELKEESTVEDAKKEILKLSKIPVDQQKLIYLGKILKDEIQLKNYKIIDGSKLMLTRMKPQDLKKLLTQHFQTSYDPTTAASLADAFIANMKNKIANYSLDDLERVAGTQ